VRVSKLHKAIDFPALESEALKQFSSSSYGATAIFSRVVEKSTVSYSAD